MRPLAALLLLAASLRAGDALGPKEKTAFLKRIAAAMADVRSFRVDFVQEKHLKVFKDTVKSTGRIVFVRPGRLRWEIRKPFRSILIVDGDNVAKFEWVRGKRRALKLGRSADAIRIAMERMRNWFNGEFEKAEKDYEVRVHAADGRHLITLVPRDEKLRKALAKLEFTPSEDLKSMRRVVIHETAGDRTEIEFKRHVPGYEPPPGTFSLTDPADLDDS